MDIKEIIRMKIMKEVGPGLEKDSIKEIPEERIEVVVDLD